jgi:hypothetical protein
MTRQWCPVEVNSCIVRVDLYEKDRTLKRKKVQHIFLGTTSVKIIFDCLIVIDNCNKLDELKQETKSLCRFN